MKVNPGDVLKRLAWAEVLIGASVGCMRNVQSLRAHCEPGNGIGEDDTWTTNIEGACGEMVFAKYRNVFWSGAIGNWKARDVAGYQVKTNISRRWDDLIIRRTDKTEEIYVSVLSFLPEFVITGWISGEEAKQEKWFRDGTKGRPAFFVPRSALHSLDTLPLLNAQVAA